MCMQSLATIGYAIKKVLADRKSDNNTTITKNTNKNKNKNNVGGHWDPLPNPTKKPDNDTRIYKVLFQPKLSGVLTANRSVLLRYHQNRLL